MPRLEHRLLREYRTVAAMVDLYCRREHDSTEEPCEPCRELKAFAELRLSKCPHGEAKPTCANCPIHCYKPERREQMRKVMRVAGPRMMLRHPIMAIRHLLDGYRKAPPRKRRAANRATG